MEIENTGQFYILNIEDRNPYNRNLNCFRSGKDDSSAKVPTSLNLHDLRSDDPFYCWVLPHYHDHCRKLPGNMGCYQGQITKKSSKLVHW